MSNPSEGICPLCKNLCQLKNSHYLPAALYKLVMRGHEPVDPAPVCLSFTKKTAIHTSRQYHAQLLCGSCENLFSQNGERIVIAQCKRSTTEFVLRDKLKGIQPTQRIDNRRIYNFNSIQSTIDANAYAYFVASILWRGSIKRWGSPDCDGYFGALGTRFEEEIRLFLLGKAAFPDKIALSFYVDFGSDTPSMLYPPHKSAKRVSNWNCREHHFYIPGIRIIALVGGQIDIAHREFGNVYSQAGQHTTFYEWYLNGTEFERGLKRQTQETKPKGLLAHKQTS